MLSLQDNELMCRVGPGTQGGEWLRRFWIPTLLSSQVPEPDCDPIEVRILGEDLVAFRDTSGAVGLIAALCPHRQAPLFYGRNEERGLRCVYHGWKFDVEGNCVDMPSEPAGSIFKDKVRPLAYPVRESAGIIWAYLGPRQLMPELPQLEWSRVPAEQRYVTKYRHNANWVQTLEGDADSSHVSFLHKSLDQLRDPEHQPAPVRYTSLDSAPTWLVQPKPYGMLMAARRNAEADSYYWRVSQWLLPFYSFIPGPLDQKRGHSHIWVPVDDYWTETWDVIWSLSEALTEQERYDMTQGPNAHIASLDPSTGYLRANAANHFLINRDAQRTKSYTGITGVREQDGALTTGMGPIADRTKEHLGTSDMAIVAMRRTILRGIKDLVGGIEPYAAQHPEEFRVRSWSYVLPKTAKFDDNPEVERLTMTLVP